MRCRYSFIVCVVRQQDGESLSGLGSTTAATVSMKHILGRVIDHVKAELGQDTVTLLDSSCGDMNWMAGYLTTRTDVDFTGYDITTSNIAVHKEKFSNQTWKFKQHDIVTEDINESFDLILSRHTMFHLKTDDVIRSLRNFRRSGSKYLLMTTQAVEANLELEDDNIAEFSKTFRVRHLNFFKEPFNLPAPLCLDKDTYDPSIFIMLYDLTTFDHLIVESEIIKEEL